jgi:hypothetical protein
MAEEWKSTFHSTRALMLMSEWIDNDSWIGGTLADAPVKEVKGLASSEAAMAPASADDVAGR